MADKILHGVESQPTANEQCAFYHIGDGLHYTISHFNETNAMLNCLITHCPGTAVWEGNGLIHLHAHNHLPSPLFPDQLKLRRRILHRVKCGDPTSYRNIFNEESSHFSRAVQAGVQWKHICTEMKAARFSLHGRIPESLQELAGVLQLPQYTVMSSTVDGQDNLFSKFVASDDRWGSLILCSSRNASFLKCVKTVFCITKNIITNYELQLLVLVANFSSYALPLVYCLMEKDILSSYQGVLSHLREINPQFDPHLVITPYNTNLKEAWNMVFPRTHVVDQLHHHFIQDLVQQLQTMHLGNFVKQRQDVKELLSMCCAIPLAPHEFLHEAFTVASREAMQISDYKEFMPLLHYIWTKWLSGCQYDVNSVSVSMFKESSTNVGIIVQNMLQNSHFSQLKNVFFLIGSFADLEETVTADIHLLLQGVSICRSKKITSFCNANIASLVTDLQHHRISIEDFITTIVPSLYPILDNYLKLI